MPLRLAVRAIILHQDRLLMVNAWSDPANPLWCAPGGGVEPHASLPDNLAREVREECGIDVTVGAPCLVNEYHAPERAFHQVELFFRCHWAGDALPEVWQDPEGVVSRRRFFSREELAQVPHKPSSLAEVAWGEGPGYDPLEPLML